MLRAAVIGLACLLAAAPAPCQEGAPPAPKPPQEFFKGKVLSFKGRRIEIAYDFSDPAQGGDWAPTYPFLRPPTSGGFRVEGKALRGDGNAGFRHRAVFDGDVKLAANLACEDARNFGAMVLSEDSTSFDIFALADVFFSLLDRKAPRQHMVTTFLPAGAGPGGSTEWRYVQTSYEPPVTGEPVDITVRKKGPLNEFRFGAGGRLGGNDKEASVGPRLAAGFYTLGSRIVVRKATVSGVLDAAWLRAQGIAFEDNVPEDPDPPETERKPPERGGEAAPPEPRPSSTEWLAHLRKLSDGALPKEEREKAADALVETKERRALRPLIDLLYGDDPVARDLANRAFKGLSGKETGFRADAPKEVRVRAMERVWAIWYQAKDLMEREEKKGKEK